MSINSMDKGQCYAQNPIKYAIPALGTIQKTLSGVEAFSFLLAQPGHPCRQ